MVRKNKELLKRSTFFDDSWGAKKLVIMYKSSYVLVDVLQDIRSGHRMMSSRTRGENAHMMMCDVGLTSLGLDLFL